MSEILNGTDEQTINKTSSQQPAMISPFLCAFFQLKWSYDLKHEPDIRISCCRIHIHTWHWQLTHTRLTAALTEHWTLNPNPSETDLITWAWRSRCARAAVRMRALLSLSHTHTLSLARCRNRPLFSAAFHTPHKHWGKAQSSSNQEPWNDRSLCYDNNKFIYKEHVLNHPQYKSFDKIYNICDWILLPHIYSLLSTEKV